MTTRVLVSLVLSVVAGATALGQEPHANHTVPTPARHASAAPLYSDGDLMFLTDMVAHHQQAIDMASLVASRSSREELLKFARYLAGVQHAEIDHMKALLNAAAERGQSVPAHETNGDPPMRGMLSKGSIAALEAAVGQNFEKLWLQGMIQHHQGAIDMALAQQQHEFEARRQPYGIAAIADDILASQRAEIGMMRTWLARW
jgi:uncharacterized protein (DUF305 family)